MSVLGVPTNGSALRKKREDEKHDLIERLSDRAEAAEEKLRGVTRIIQNGTTGGRSDAAIVDSIRDALECATAPWPPPPLRRPSCCCSPGVTSVECPEHGGSV